jgi:pyruvate kinase
VPDLNAQFHPLLGELKDLRESCLATEREFADSIAEACPQSSRSVQNLLHYLALRKHDLRDLQSRLTALGLSSLGRTEPNALAGLDAVINALESLTNCHISLAGAPSSSVDFNSGPAILSEQADHLLGAAPPGRAVRIMVTMPLEAASSYELVRDLVNAGMDVMRVNCAHDSEREWTAMIDNMRRANRELGKRCKVQMDLAGPKLRTGPLHRGHRVAHWHVTRDMRGHVTAPARIALACGRVPANAARDADIALPVTGRLVRAVRPGDHIRIKDSRGKKRDLHVADVDEGVCFCNCEQGGYVLTGASLTLTRRGHVIGRSRLGVLPLVEEPYHLAAKDMLILTKEDLPPGRNGDKIPRISCTLPEAFAAAQAGQPIFFDDGKIEGVIREAHPDHMLVEITHTGPHGAKLGSAKGINLPGTTLDIPALTAKDRQDLDFVTQHADLVGLSFVRKPQDVLDLQQELATRGQSSLGMVLKIESRQAFDQLPLIMIAALRHHPVGIMVARGDLAVEIGFERLAEVQEEILWLSEAAHMPVIWATQVLETLAKTGMPSRAEVTDAAMGVRAECVMLNKGEHIVEAVRFLDNVLHRMQAHQLKKRSMLRRLAVAQVNHAVAHS